MAWNTLEFWENRMAWNYETGKEEPSPYTDPIGGIYSAPVYAARISDQLFRWNKAETEAWYKRKSTTAFLYTCAAIREWERLERVMTWDDEATKAEFRRKYIEFLAKTDILDCDLGLKDLDVDSLPILQRIIAVGYRQLAKTAHPDMGGTTEEFNELRQGKVQLDSILKEVKDLL